MCFFGAPSVFFYGEPGSVQCGAESIARYRDMLLEGFRFLDLQFVPYKNALFLGINPQESVLIAMEISMVFESQLLIILLQQAWSADLHFFVFWCKSVGFSTGFHSLFPSQRRPIAGFLAQT